MINPEDITLPTSKLAYEFKDELCARLYYRAGTSTQYWAFAWRESPGTLENHWKKKTKGFSHQDKLDLLKACFLAADAQEKARKENKASFRPKGIAPWFNSGGWGDGVAVKEMDRPTVDGRLCKCGQPVHGPDYDKCTGCLPFENGKIIGNLADELRDYYLKHPEIKNYTRDQHIALIRKNLARIGHK